MFGASSGAAPAFGAATGASSIFGAASGANPAAGATSIFGASTGAAPAFGASSGAAPIFGAASGTPSLFGQSSGAATGFGMSSSSGSSSLFGASSGAATTFGLTSGAAPAFGASSGASSLFGASSGAAPAFGASSGASSLFGASSGSAPAFGASSGSSSLFGAASGAAPAFGASSGASSLFGASSGAAPAFGAAPAGTANASGGLFGAAGAAIDGAGSGPGGPAPAFQLDVFEELHGQAVARLVSSAETSGGSRHAGDAEDSTSFTALREKRDALSRPFVFRGREDTVDLQTLARHVMQQHTRLASERLIQVVDEVSKGLRLHQQDCCMLVERALDESTGHDFTEVLRRCAAIYYRECHFQALCLHDMAQTLARGTSPDCRGVAFFAMMGGRRFVRAIFEALGLMLRDLTGEKTGDHAFQLHAGTVIQLLVQTLLAYFFAFQADVEEAEQMLSLLPHVVNSQHAPLGQGFTVSDLDLILHEESADISMKLCLAIVCMFHQRMGDGRLDITKVPENVEPGSLRLQEYYVPQSGSANGGAGCAASGFGGLASSPLGAKMRIGDYWNEESQLGQFLGFAIGGLVFEDDRALRNGYIRWQVVNFLLHEALLSPSLAGDSCTSQLVLICLQDLFGLALLPVGRRWVGIKKLEAQAVNYRHIAPDTLQMSLIQTLNRLCRLHPSACETFREIAVHCSDTFHLTLGEPSARGPGGVFGGAGPGGNWGRIGGGAGLFQDVCGGGASTLSRGYGADLGLPGGAAHSAAWLGAPPSTTAGAVGFGGAANLPLTSQARHDGTALYAEILDFLATLIGRGSMHCARLMCQKLMSHSNQWFNWGFLVDTLTQMARAAPVQTAAAFSSAFGSSDVGGYGQPVHQQQHHRAAPFPAALCHLTAAMCSSRLWVSHPAPPQPSAAPGSTGVSAFTAASAAAAVAGPMSALGAAPHAFAGLLMDLLSAHPEPTVKGACLTALSHLDFSPEQSRMAYAQLSGLLPVVLAGISDVRGSADGTLGIGLLSCALRLVQTIPLSRGRYALDLQPLTYVVVHHVFLKALADPSQFSSAARYWRLASLALRWTRLVLRGPLPLGALPEVNRALVEPYADGSNDLVAEVMTRTSSGNATAYAFRCLLTLDSPLLARTMYLVLLRGRCVQGLEDCRHMSATRLFMEQAVTVGLDVLRILLQRDVLFLRLYGEQAADRIADGAAGLDAGEGLLLTHQTLLSEFAFQYPPADALGSNFSAGRSSLANPFAGQRLWQGALAGTTMDAGIGGMSSGDDAMLGPMGSTVSGGGRANPSYIAMLVEFVGARNNLDIAKLAVYVFTQCSLREPSKLHRTLQLEPWRLQCLGNGLRDLITQPEEETAVMAVEKGGRRWDSRTEAVFMYEAIEMDVPIAPDASSHLDVTSFKTGLPVCGSVDTTYQFADDALVQSADLAAWAKSAASSRMGGAGSAAAALSTHSATSADAGRFRTGYLRGLDVDAGWLSIASTMDESLLRQGNGAAPRDDLQSRGLASLIAAAAAPPEPVLAGTTCRKLVLRSLLLLLSGGGAPSTAENVASGAASKLAQALLGLDPEGSLGTKGVDVDVKRAGQSLLLDAVMNLLEHPPPMPVHGDSEFRLNGASLMPRSRRGAGLEPHEKQAVEQHATWEAAIGVVVALLTAPALREVAIRYVWFGWPSRYSVLRTHLGMPWEQAPLPLRRVLLSETTLLLRVVAWEMRLVLPTGIVHIPPSSAPRGATGGMTGTSASDSMDDLTGLGNSIETQQHFDLRRGVADHLKDVVLSLVASDAGGIGRGDADGSSFANFSAGAMQSDSPALVIAAALRLAEACDSSPRQEFGDGCPRVVLRNGVAEHYRNPVQDMIRASRCSCLAPNDVGPLALDLELTDPHLFLNLAGSLASLHTLRPTLLDGPTIAEGGADAGAGGFGSSDVAAVLKEIGASNEASCMSYFARASYQAYTLFVSAVFYHLCNTAWVRGGAVMWDPRAEIVRKHLEALMPALASTSLEACSPIRLELLTELLAILVSAMQEIDGATPLSFAYELFGLLRGAALHPLGTPASKRSSQRALMLLVQRMLPEMRNDPLSWVQLEVAPEDLTALRQLARGLLASAGSPAQGGTGAAVLLNNEGLAERYRFGGVAALLSAAASGTDGSSTSVGRYPRGYGGGLSSNGPDAALMLLAALLVRVPRAQLAEVFDCVDMWRQVVQLLGGIWPSQQQSILPAQTPRMRPANAIVAALLCQTPQLAASFYEHGGLAAVLQPDFLQAAQARVSLTGLQTLDGPHPAPLLAILYILVAVVGALPTHRLVLHGVIAWLERHVKSILEIIQWLSRLPLTSSLEPRSQSFDGFAASSAGAVHSAAAVTAVAASSAGILDKSALLLLCTGSAGEMLDTDSSLELAATLAVASDRWWSSPASSGIAEITIGQGTARPDIAERDRLVALCYRCALLLAELWALLARAVLRCSGCMTMAISTPSELQCAMERLTPQLEPALQVLFAQTVSLTPPAPRQLEAAAAACTSNGAGMNSSGSTSRFGIQSDGSAALAAATAAAAAEALQQQGIYPSEPSRLALSLHVLHAWRHDPIAQQVSLLMDYFGTAPMAASRLATEVDYWSATVQNYQAQPGAGLMGMPQPVVPIMPQLCPQRMVEVLAQARARTAVLCTAAVHGCDALLKLRFVGPATATPGADLTSLRLLRAGDSPHLEFEGSRTRFRQLVLMVEMTLHLLCVNLSLLVVAADAVGAASAPAAPSPAVGAPRLAVVAQYLGVLRQFAAAVGGAVAPVSASLTPDQAKMTAGGIQPHSATAAVSLEPNAVEIVDLSFVANLAERVERLLSELQTL